MISFPTFNVMAGLFPAIHAPMKRTTAWMTGANQGVTVAVNRAASLGDVPYGA